MATIEISVNAEDLIEGDEIVAFTIWTLDRGTETITGSWIVSGVYQLTPTPNLNVYTNRGVLPRRMGDKVTIRRQAPAPQQAAEPKASEVNATAENFQDADFADFAVGDRIRFVTNDNGYGGMGQVWRTGTVAKVTAKTIKVDCDANLLGDTATLRRDDWNTRSPMRAVTASDGSRFCFACGAVFETTRELDTHQITTGHEMDQPDNPAHTRQPYDADHVAIVDMGTTVWALWIPDTEQARDPKAVADNICDRKYADVEMVATMSRLYKRDGASYSGWVVDGDGGYSDCIPRKRDAMRELHKVIRDHFNR